MPHIYDPQNIFARILRGEIPNKTVLETEHSLAFHDINPAAPVHVLVICKGPYVTYDHFAAEASAAEIVDFHRAFAQVCAEVGVHGMQEVPHFHMHILGGLVMGPLIQR